ncbi:MAG: hypothetical protein RI893_376 [Pseudomonadota bacterium]|jgi:hypothetical protein
MHAIEFEAQTHDGVVQIPPQYRAWKNKNVHVILLESEEERTKVQKPKFIAAALNTQNYRFDREQANER